MKVSSDSTSSSGGLAGRLGRILEALIARAVALDSATGDRLAMLDGRSVQIALRQPPLQLHATVQQRRVVISPAEVEADLSLRTDLGGLIALAGQKLSGQPLPAGALMISGDADLARQLERIVSAFDPDWDAAWSDAFGDVLGFQLGRGARGALAWAKRSAGHLTGSAAEYLQEESRAVVAAPELDAFFDEVDALRDGAANAQLRLQRLRSKRGLA